MTAEDQAPTPGLRARWDTLGTAVALRLEGAEVLRVELPMRSPVATAVGTHRSRPLTLVHLVCRDLATGAVVDGWGESAALGDTTYDAEDVAGVWDALVRELVPWVAAAARSLGGLVPSLGSLRPLADAVPDRPLAYSALEAAVADAHLRAAGLPLAALLGVAGTEVAPGAVVGTAEAPDEVVAAAAGWAEAGYARVKVKIEPGTEFEVVSALARWAASVGPGAPALQVDANGAYGPDDLDRLAALDPFGLLCIEQPFARGDLAAHRELADRISTPVCLDESLDGPASVMAAVGSGACSVVCVKPARLGGIGNALDVVAWCDSVGVPWWVGGMFESGLGRRVTTVLGALPGAALPGDLAPPDAYLATDLVAPVAVRRDPGPGGLRVAVSDAPGLAPVPDHDTVEDRMCQWAEVPLA